MYNIDRHEELIIKELVRNPRLSDNELAKRTSIPVTTVNRKRKNLEKAGILSYFVHVAEPFGKGTNKVKQLYIIKFKEGISIQTYLEKLRTSQAFKADNAKYHVDSYVGEKDGHFALVIIVEADSEAELVEIFHSRIVKGLRMRHGNDCIADIFTTKVIYPIRIHHNYLPLFNMQDGKIADAWQSEWLHIPLKKSSNH